MQTTSKIRSSYGCFFPIYFIALVTLHLPPTNTFELDTKLTDYIGDLLNQYEPDLQNVQTGNEIHYGCWCHFTIEQLGANQTRYHHEQGRGSPVDELDRVCQNLAKGYRCVFIDSDFDRSCEPYTIEYSGGSGTMMECDDDDDGGIVGECKSRACYIETGFVHKMYDMAVRNVSIDSFAYGHNSTFDFASECPHVPPKDHTYQECCGDYPDRFTYTTDGIDQCCGHEVYDSGEEDCCEDTNDVVDKGEVCETTTQATTLEPTTLVPPTLQPTTLEPTTLEPTTLEPTTLEPTTLEPTTTPTTAAPTTTTEFICSPERAYGRGIGDPHWYSFDGQATDYQGNCEYIATEVCNSTDIENEPYFRISAKQDHYNSRHKWTTWLTFIRIKYQQDASSEVIEIKKGVPGWGKDTSATIKIGETGVEEPLLSPFDYSEHKIVTSGFGHRFIYLGVEDPENSPPTDFKIKIQITTHTFDVELNCLYRGKVCGLLGNFNGHPGDDWVNGVTGEEMVIPGGRRRPSNRPLWDASWIFGNSWLVPEIATCADDLDQDFEPCSAAEELYITDNYCVIFEDPFFIVNGCSNLLVNTQDECIYDLCFTPEEDRNHLICEMVDRYVDSCSQLSGVGFADWRDNTAGFESCPASCPDPTMVYYVSDGCYEATDSCNGPAVTKCDGNGEMVPRCNCPYETVWDFNTNACVRCEFTCPSTPTKACSDGPWVMALGPGASFCQAEPDCTFDSCIGQGIFGCHVYDSVENTVSHDTFVSLTQVFGTGYEMEIWVTVNGDDVLNDDDQFGKWSNMIYIGSDIRNRAGIWMRDNNEIAFQWFQDEGTDASGNAIWHDATVTFNMFDTFGSILQVGESYFLKFVVTEHELIAWVGNEFKSTALGFTPTSMFNAPVYMSRHAGLIMGDHDDAMPLGDTSLWTDEEPEFYLSGTRIVKTSCVENGCVCSVTACSSGP